MRPDDSQLRALLAAAAEGDNAALGELVRLAQPHIWRVCTALGTPGDEADLVQETFLRAMSSLRGYRSEAPVIMWLTAIARNVCVDDVRRRQRRRRLVEKLTTVGRERHTVAHESIDDLLEQIDPERREAFLLTQYSGLSYGEAAEVLECPIGTIRSRVARARADLAGVLQRAEAR